MPLLWAVTRGFTRQSGFLSLAFLRLSRNALDSSISDLTEEMVVPLGSVMVLTVLPYSTVQDTFLPSPSSGKSSDLAMRSSSKVMPGSVMSSRALP